MNRKITAFLGGILLLSLTTACSTPSAERDAPRPIETQVAAPAETKSPVETYAVKPSSTDLGCVEAISAAAAVPGAEGNNDEIYVSLLACPTFSEWFSALRATPGVFAATSIAESDDEWYAMLACFGAEETPVCTDAATLGLV